MESILVQQEMEKQSKGTLKEQIIKKQSQYENHKAELENIISKGRSTYTAIVNDFDTQKNYIKNSSIYSKDGKDQKIKDLNRKYYFKAKSEAEKINSELINYSNKSIEEINESKVKSNLKGSQLVQITYVNSMINMINNLEDAELLNEVFDYICLEENFGDELVNMVYLKAKSILSEPRESADNTSDGMKRSQLKSTLQGITTKIKDYKYDYAKDLDDSLKMFDNWNKVNKYPSNLYMADDISKVFGYYEPLDTSKMSYGEKVAQINNNKPTVPSPWVKEQPTW